MTSENCRRRALPGASDARWLVLLLAVWLSWETFSFGLPATRPADLPTVYGLVLVLAAGIVLSARLLRHGTSPLPMRTFAVGTAFSLAGATFDMVATVLHSPDLSDEQNPYARALLDSGHGLVFVYAYCLVCNFAHQGMVILLWAAFLRHRAAIVDQFCRFRQRWKTLPAIAMLLSPGAWSRLIRQSYAHGMYACVWQLTAISIVGAAYRWYLGLEWFGLFSGYALNVAFCSGFAGLAVYYAWIWRASRAPISAGPVEAEPL